MKNLISLLIFLQLFFQVASQDENDSLVLFSDLKFHSDFEKDAFLNFISDSTDTFNLFLAIDKDIGYKKANQFYEVYKSIYKKPEIGNIENKKLKKKIKLVYSSVHSFFLRKYNELEYFSSIFQDGTYNCVSASILYSIIFDELNIPYKVQASSNHVYLVANPGKNSIVIETTNPMFENRIFNGEFKRQYVLYLKESKLISDDEFKNRSVEEIFEQKFNEVKDSEFRNLPGFQYYNKAIEKIKNNKIDEAYILCQKAYYFYPDNQVKTLFYNILLAQLEVCTYNNVEDIDFLVQLSRFNNIDPEIFSSFIYQITSKKLEYTGNDDFCDSIYIRFISKCNNKAINDEVGFIYNLQMFQHNQNSAKGEKYIENALKFKSNHKLTINQFSFVLKRKLDKIYDNFQLLDTLPYYENKYKYDFVKPIIDEYRSKAYLRIAKEYFNSNKIKSGNKYLLLFEENCVYPLENRYLEYDVETTYRKAALYYYYRKNKIKTKEYIERGLKYVPESDLLRLINH